MKLTELFQGLYQVKEDLEIKDLSFDSREAGKDSIFFALKGYDHDGHQYIQKAYEQGTRVFVVEDVPEELEGAQYFKTKDTRALLSTLSSRFYREPHKELVMIGVTGTKGKTTTTNIIKTILDHNDIPTGIIGTMGIFFGDQELKSPNTTPESKVIFHALRAMVDAGMKACVMEVSSGGIQHGRVKDLHFDHGIFLNLGLDHVGDREHPTFEDYRNCKAKLFAMSDKSYLNTSDAAFHFMADHVANTLIEFGEDAKDYTLLSTVLHKEGAHLSQDLTVEYGGESFDFNLPLPGDFNASNALASIAVTHEMGLDFASIQRGLDMVSIKGRFEMFPTEDRLFIIDYAHNGVSLETLLKTIRSFKPKRIGILMGCIGGRSHVRREGICQAIVNHADFAVLTEDNPDTEDPKDILEDMLRYFKDSSMPLQTDPVRSSAVEKLVEASEPGDILILAGKGHETYNIVHHQYLPYSDEEELKKALKKRGLTLLRKDNHE